MQNYGHDFISRSKKNVTKLWMLVVLSLSLAILFSGIHYVIEKRNEQLIEKFNIVNQKTDESVSVSYSNKLQIQQLADDLKRMRVNQIRDRKMIIDSIEILKKIIKEK